MTRDYNIVNWHELVSYSEESPSGIVWATNRGCMFTGVSSVIRDGVLFGYRADAAQESGDKAFFLYSVARYGEDLALKLAMTTRTHMLEQRNREGAGYAEGSIYI